MKHASKQELEKVAREMVQPIITDLADQIRDFRAELIRQEKLLKGMSAELQGLKTRVSVGDRKLEASVSMVLKRMQELDHG